MCDGLWCGGGMVRWQCEVTLIGVCVMGYGVVEVW